MMIDKHYPGRHNQKRHGNQVPGYNQLDDQTIAIIKAGLDKHTNTQSTNLNNYLNVVNDLIRKTNGSYAAKSEIVSIKNPTLKMEVWAEDGYVFDSRNELQKGSLIAAKINAESQLGQEGMIRAICATAKQNGFTGALFAAKDLSLDMMAELNGAIEFSTGLQTITPFAMKRALGIKALTDIHRRYDIESGFKSGAETSKWVDALDYTVQVHDENVATVRARELLAIKHPRHPELPLFNESLYERFNSQNDGSWVSVPLNHD